MSELLRSLTKNEQSAQVAHQKWANERIARFFYKIAHSLIFSQKTSDSLRKPMSEFPALVPLHWCAENFLMHLIICRNKFLGRIAKFKTCSLLTLNLLTYKSKRFNVNFCLKDIQNKLSYWISCFIEMWNLSSGAV